MKLYNLLFISIFSLVLLLACDDTIPSDADIPDENISYSLHLQPVFNVKCATSDCHSSYSYAGGYSMQSWIETKTPPYIIEGEPNNSLAYLAATSQAGLSVMPPVDVPIFPLTEREIYAFKTWIAEGAKNN